jgi:hypothetical protein
MFCSGFAIEYVLNQNQYLQTQNFLTFLQVFLHLITYLQKIVNRKLRKLNRSKVCEFLFVSLFIIPINIYQQNYNNLLEL